MRRLALVLVLLIGCAGPTTSTTHPETRSREVVNLRAFARLYGVVRWFHPSDEAADTDWNAFTIRGVAAVRGAHDQKELATALRALVQPIGPTIVIGSAADVAKPAAPLPAPPAGAKVESVAWQYAGPGFDGGGGPYQGKRTGRTGYVRTQGAWGAFSQAIDAVALRGKRVRLRAQLRAGKDSQVGAWLRVDLPAGGTGFFDNMMDRSVSTAAWTPATIEGDVAGTAEKVVFGGLVTGDEGWFDDFVLDVGDGRGGWAPVVVADGDFESGANGWSAGVGKSAAESFALTVDAGAHDAKAAGHLSSPREALTEDLFAERPADGEAVVIDLGDGLAARVPLSLTSVDGHTMPRGAPAAAATETTGSASDRGIADVIVAWNVFADFYPYLDVIKADWHAYLDDALEGAIAAGDNVEAQHDALRKVIVTAEDGHGSLTSDYGRAGLPMVLGLVEGKVLVLASTDAAVARGDEIVTIDGVAAGAALDAERARHSGSPQWSTNTALMTLGAGAENSMATLDVLHDGAPVHAIVKRGAKPNLYTYPPIGEVEPGVWLVDLSRADIDDINAKMDALAAAKGIVFDMRGYPNGTHEVLAHLMDAAEHDKWMHVPHVIRPNVVGQPRPEPTFESVGWDMEPVAPRFYARVAFLTGPGAISYAESVMGYVEALKLPVVGGATAGTNGNIRAVTVPSGAQFIFTGMKVTRHDGTRSHLEGIRPTVPVERTIAGVRAGRDEVLERGIALVR